MQKILLAVILLAVSFTVFMPQPGVSSAPTRSKRPYADGEVILKLKADAADLSAGELSGSNRMAEQEPGRGMAMARTLGERVAGTRLRRVEAIVPAGANQQVGRLIAGRGLDRMFVLKLEPGVDVESVINQLQASGAVEYAEPNYRIEVGSIIPDDPGFRNQWALKNPGYVDGYYVTINADIKATDAWPVTTGSQDVIVALTDTGVDATHPDLARSTYTNPNEIPGNGVDDDHNGYIDDVHGYDVALNVSDTSDVMGHGTQMAGIIAAEMGNHIGISGVSQSKILPVKFFKRTGPFPEEVEATAVDATRALLYAVAAGADIINASWSTLLYDATEKQARALQDAVAAIGDAGILLVCIAGNQGFNNDVSKIYPASYQMDHQIVVAATDYNDEIWRPRADPYGLPNSGFGPNTVHLGAPGVSVFTTLARGDCILCSDSEAPEEWYGWIEGTSASAAFVSGVAALVKSKYPDEYVTILRRRILESVDVRPQLQPFIKTSGRLNAAAALQIQIDINPPVLASVKYKGGGEKLFVSGTNIQRGAVLVIGNQSFSLKEKGSSKLLARVPSSVLPSGTSTAVRLRNPDGGISQPFTFNR